MGGVVRTEVLVDGVLLSRAGAGGHGSLDELADAVAHKASHVVEGMQRHVVRGERGVGGDPEVLDGVEQGSV